MPAPVESCLQCALECVDVLATHALALHVGYEPEANKLAEWCLALYVDAGEILIAARNLRRQFPSALRANARAARSITAHEPVSALGCCDSSYVELAGRVVHTAEMFAKVRLLPVLSFAESPGDVATRMEADQRAGASFDDAFVVRASELFATDEIRTAVFADVSSACEFYLRQIAVDDRAVLEYELRNILAGARLELCRLEAPPPSSSGGTAVGSPAFKDRPPAAEAAAPSTNGRPERGLQGKGFKLVEFLKNRGGQATVYEVCVEIWGDEEKASTSTFRSLISRTNTEFLQMGSRASIDAKGQRVRLNEAPE